MDRINESHITVIGGGPGGYAAAITAARMGAQVTLIEKARLGGTCLNEGCIPTKALLKCADSYVSARKASIYGLDINQMSYNHQQAIRFKNQVVNQLVGGVQGLVKANKINLIQGEAKIKEPRAITITTASDILTLKTRNTIIATGAKEIEIPGFKINGIDILNSSQMLECKDLPQKLAIIGGGVIGVEFASIFCRLGVPVTIVELTPRLIPTEDEEISKVLKQILEKNGTEVLLEAKTKEIVKRDSNDLLLQVELNDGNIKDIDCSHILVCVGRRAVIQEVGAREVGIQIEKGRITTDRKMRTNVEGIYAIGDITTSEQLAHVAYYEARVAVQNIMGIPCDVDYTAIPHCIYSAPEIATVGLTEKAANEQYSQVKIAKFSFHGNGKALIEGSAEGFVKLVIEKATGRILGAAIIGPKATELIAEYALAVNLGLKVTDIVNTVHAHPTLSEALHEAGLTAIGLNLHSI